jgi:hypothetical protein
VTARQEAAPIDRAAQVVLRPKPKPSDPLLPVSDDEIEYAFSCGDLDR